MTQPFFISVVDDDVAVRESLVGLLTSMGFDVASFSSAGKFLNSHAITITQCLILDIRMPGMSGTDLQRELGLRGKPLPIIFISSDCDTYLQKQVLASGAVACLRKPFSDPDLLAAIDRCRVPDESGLHQ